MARMADARGVSGLHRLPEVLPWPGVIGSEQGVSLRWPVGETVGGMRSARGVGQNCRKASGARCSSEGGLVSGAVCARLGEDAKAQGLSDLPDCGKPGFGWGPCRRIRRRLSAVRNVMPFDPRQAFESKILLGDPYPILMEMMRHFALRSAVLRLSLRPLNRSGGPENER